MIRKEIVASPEYWTAKAQIDLYNCAEDYMRDKGMNRTQLAQHLGVSKGYISQLLNGDFDHKLSKFMELALAFGRVPKIELIPVEEVINEDRHEFCRPKWTPVNYNVVQIVATEHVMKEEKFEFVQNGIILNPKAA